MERKPDCHSQNIRIKYRTLRDTMSMEEVQEKSKKICLQILQTDWYEKSAVLYGYYPLGNEVDCRLLLTEALRAKKRVALPKTEDGFRMEFYEITDIKQVRQGRFHVMEPVDECPLIREESAHVLVPGVVFDVQGNRMGYGKGYYDRYFARFLNLQRMALAYENQIEARLIAKKTDIPMHCIYTEENSYQI